MYAVDVFPSLIDNCVILCSFSAAPLTWQFQDWFSENYLSSDFNSFTHLQFQPRRCPLTGEGYTFLYLGEHTALILLIVNRLNHTTSLRKLQHYLRRLFSSYGPFL